MAEKKNILTYTGLKKYEDELHDLKVNKRQEIAQKIKEAREQGDLSENAEYDAAKDEQRDIEARIVDLEKLLKNAEVVVEDEIDLDKISIGCQVKVLDVEEDEEMEFKIVGSTEANSLDGKISNESPAWQESWRDRRRRDTGGRYPVQDPGHPASIIKRRRSERESGRAESAE